MAFLPMLTAQPVEDGNPKTRKAKSSDFDIQAFNELMLRAVDNSANNVKLSVPPGDYRVAGTLVDHDGNAIAGAQVLLAGERRGPELYLANFDQTDEHGRFLVRSDRSSRILYVRIGDRYFEQRTQGKREIRITIPELYSIALIKPDDIGELHDSILLSPVDTASAHAQTLGDLRTTFVATNAGKLRVAKGDYRVVGSRRLVAKDGHTMWGTAHLGQISVTANDGQTFELRRGGVTVHGSLKQVDWAMKSLRGSNGVKVVLSTGEGNGQQLLDVVMCDEAGDFELNHVPAGRYQLELRSLLKLVGNQGTRFSSPRAELVFHQQKIDVADQSVQTDLKRRNESEHANATVQEVHRILRSQHPQPNVSWSWSDVQVADLIRLKDRRAAQTELLRLITSDETPGDWRYLALRALPSMTPLPDDTVPRLAEALHKPAIGRYRGSILQAIRKMSEGVDAVPILLPLKDDEDWRLRYSVADALGEIASGLIEPPDEIVATLIDFLDDPHGVVRKEAAGCLGVLHIPGATEALKRHLSDPWDPARALIAWALFECSGEPQDAVATMIDILENGDDEGRNEAAYYLRMFDHRAEAAIPTLRPYLAYDKKPPFSNSNETAKYQLRRAAERAIQVIEASRSWRDASPRFELGVAAIDLKSQVSGTVKWGTAVDGIQLGIMIDSVRKSFAVGERVPIALLIRNLNGEAVRLEMDRRLPDVAPAVTRITKRQSVKQSRLLLSPGFFVFDVEPGSTCWIASNGLGLGSPPNSNGLWLPFLREVKSAPHTISQRYRFERYDLERGTKKRIWLTTGNATFNVVDP